MEHVAEEVLVRYALDAQLVGNRDEVEHHLLTCQDCSRTLADIRSFDEGLSDADTWTGIEEDDDRSRRFEELRQLAQNVESEDAEAQQLLVEFDGAPAARFVWADLPAKAEYHTAGVVRLLCKRAHSMFDRDPPYALVLAEAAVAIAAKLSDEKYPSNALHQWRGEAWKEQSYSLYCLGRFPEALVTLDHAQGEYDLLPHSGVGHVAVLYIRALVMREQDDFNSAGRHADDSAAAALHLGAIDYYMAARDLRGAIHFHKRELNSAALLFQNILQYGERIESPVWIARESLNLGLCYFERGNFRDARRYIQRALNEFTALRFDTEVTRTRWASARLMFAEGTHQEAIQQLRRCIDEMTTAQMLTDAAIAAVHLAEMLHVTGRDREIPRLLNGVVQTFTQAGKLTGALMALAYLKDAAAAGRLTKSLASHVREFLSRANRQPALLFTPPPPDEPV